MQHAIDIAGKRIRPSSSGEVAFCDFCKRKVIGKCGKIYIWHWAHINGANCDLWKEGETEWHREWKNKFPEDWQEKIIEKNDQKHIADILTPNGIVIEFQNSAISPSVIAERERFYEKMIWVINAQEFKHNLVTENLTDKLLSELANRYSKQKSSLQRHESHRLLNLKAKQNKLASEVQSRESELRQLNSITEIFSRFDKNPETFAIYIIDVWQSENLLIDPSLIEITNHELITTKNLFFRKLGELKRNKHFLNLVQENVAETEKYLSERSEILADLESLKPALKDELILVASKILDLESEIAQLERTISFLKNENKESDIEIQQQKKSIDNYILTNLKVLEDEFNEERSKILEDKDKLNLIWKHERKSWASADAPIFLDIGNDNLLYKYPNGKVSVVSVSDFLNKYNSGASAGI